MLRSLTNLKFNRMNYIVLRNFAKRFTKEHEWVDVQGEVATIGITDYAQNELGEIVHVDLPSIGTQFKIQDTLVITIKKFFCFLFISLWFWIN